MPIFCSYQGQNNRKRKLKISSFDAKCQERGTKTASSCNRLHQFLVRTEKLTTIVIKTGQVALDASRFHSFADATRIKGVERKPGRAIYCKGKGAWSDGRRETAIGCSGYQTEWTWLAVETVNTFSRESFRNYPPYFQGESATSSGLNS